MGPEGGIVGGLVLAEPGIPHQLEGQFLGGPGEDAGVKLPDAQDEGLQQFLEAGVGRLALLLVGVVPVPVVVGLQGRQVV